MEINFCKTCDNLLFIYSEPETNKLYLGCKQCGNQEKYTENSCIHNNQFNVELQETIVNNQYLVDDITLPSIEDNINMKCPNVNCVSNTDEDTPSNILYLKYDESSMKYIYICKHCKQSWKNK